MGATLNAKRRRAQKRDLFAELKEGMLALGEHRKGKRTLRTHAMEFKPAPQVTPKELLRVRQDLKISRALFAGYLRTNVRTLENWEQGRAKPNAQAALLSISSSVTRTQSKDSLPSDTEHRRIAGPGNRVIATIERRETVARASTKRNLCTIAGGAV